MKFGRFEEIMPQKRGRFGSQTYKHISEVLKETKGLHKKDWSQNPTPGGDHEQSWRAFKGKNLENLVQHIITEEVQEPGLKVINGNRLERSRNLPIELSQVKRNLAIDYGVHFKVGVMHCSPNECIQLLPPAWLGAGAELGPVR